MRDDYRIDNPDEIPSPALLVFASIVRANLDAMIAMAGGPDRLRPHVKTHKMAAIIGLQSDLGITKHKCATIAEAEMIARSGGADVLIAYPLVGPNLPRFARLVAAYPETVFRAVVDHPDSVRGLAEVASALAGPIPTLIDLDVGMGRTGIAPGPAAEALYELIATTDGLRPDGLHIYDGHHRAPDLAERRRAVAESVAPAFALRDRLIAAGLPIPRLVLGGTPTFPIHAEDRRPGVELSPGTSTLHDAGYGAKFPDLPFRPAALLLTRVVSHPGRGRVTLDLGHKAVAADPVGARLVLPDHPDATLGGQSEEHLVVEFSDRDSLPIGTHLLAIPTHICPTVALHQFAHVIDRGRVVDRWEVSARNRTLTV